MTQAVRETGTRPAPARETVGARVDELDAWSIELGLPTPVFGFVPNVLRSGVERLRAGLRARVSYATKANPHPRVLRELMALVDEFNVTNIVHLDQLLALGAEPRRIAWLHPVLTPSLRDAVLARGVHRFVVDDRRGLDLLLEARARVALTLRLLPPDSGESARLVVRFGNTAGALRQLARAATDAGAAVEAVSFFVGTDGAGMGEALPFRCGIEALARLHAQLRDDCIPIPTVNIGGGFPGSRRRFHLDHPTFFERIRHALDTELGPGTSVVCEPGRYLVEPALVLLTRVLADRVLDGRRLVHVDASAYAGLFESSFVDREAGLTIWAADGGGPLRPGELVGPVMDSFDVIRKGGLLPPLHEGGLLVIPNVGAYSVGYTTECEGVSAPRVVPVPGALAAVLSEEWFW